MMVMKMIARGTQSIPFKTTFNSTALNSFLYFSPMLSLNSTVLWSNLFSLHWPLILPLKIARKMFVKCLTIRFLWHKDFKSVLLLLLLFFFLSFFLESFGYFVILSSEVWIDTLRDKENLKNFNMFELH